MQGEFVEDGVSIGKRYAPSEIVKAASLIRFGGGKPDLCSLNEPLDKSARQEIINESEALFTPISNVGCR
jgi:hypothetical protein